MSRSLCEILAVKTGAEDGAQAKNASLSANDALIEPLIVFY